MSADDLKVQESIKNRVWAQPEDPWSHEIRMVRIGRVHLPAFKVKSRTVASSYALALVTRGQGTFLDSDGKEQTLRRGDVFTWARGKAHRFQASSQGLNYWLVTAVGSSTRDWFARHQWSVQVHKVNNASAVEKAMRALGDQAFSGVPWARAVCASLFVVLMFELLRGTTVHGGVAGNAGTQLYQRVRRYMEEHYLELRSIKVMSEELGVSAEHLSRTFQYYEDQSPHQFLEGLKMNEATERLMDQDQTIAAVAQALNYPDPFSFSKRFKKWYGVSPGAWRKGLA